MLKHALAVMSLSILTSADAASEESNKYGVPQRLQASDISFLQKSKDKIIEIIGSSKPNNLIPWEKSDRSHFPYFGETYLASEDIYIAISDKKDEYKGNKVYQFNKIPTAWFEKRNEYGSASDFLYKNIEKITINGQTGWHLPSSGDYERFSKIKIPDYGHKLTNGNACMVYLVTSGPIVKANWQFKYEDQAKCPSGLSRMNRWCGGEIKFDCEKNNLTSNDSLLLIRKSNIFDKISGANNISAEEKISLIAAGIVNQKLQPRPFSESKPSRNVHQELVSEKKGEFESTLDYEKRVQDENDKLNAIKNKENIEYESNLLKFNEKKFAFEEQEAARIAKLLNSQSMSDIYYDAKKVAANIVLGDPIIKSIQYNADVQEFSVLLKSTLNDISIEAKFPAEISKAPALKEKISDSRMLLGVLLDSEKIEDGSKLYVYDNAEKRTNDLRIAIASRSVDRLNEFLGKYVDAPEKNLVQGKISELLGEERRREVAQRAYEAEQTRLRTVAAQREAADYSSRKSVGDKVCTATRLWFVKGIIKGYVEGVSGDNIQIRVSDDGGFSSFDGDPVGINSILWSPYYSWRLCS